MKEATILNVLREKGYRITKPRREIVTILLAMEEPLTISDIVMRVRGADAASVYRLVGLLREEGMLEVVHGVGNERYELAHEHHHHAVCTKCGHMAHVPCTNAGLPPTSRVFGFHSIVSHEVMLYGICTRCHN